MGDTLYAGHQGLARYSNQQILYDWNKFEQRSSLPHGAFIGQCDPRANGDEWQVMRVGAQQIAEARFITFARSNRLAIATSYIRAYKAGDYHLVLEALPIAANGLLADTFAEGFISIRSGDGVGMTNRIMGITLVSLTASLKLSWSIRGIRILGKGLRETTMSF